MSPHSWSEPQPPCPGALLIMREQEAYQDLQANQGSRPGCASQQTTEWLPVVGLLSHFAFGA